MSRPDLRVIAGGMVDSPFPESAQARIERSEQRLVEAARRWASTLLGSRALESLDLASDDGRAALALLDSVDEYEHHVSQQNGPATAR